MKVWSRKTEIYINNFYSLFYLYFFLSMQLFFGHYWTYWTILNISAVCYGLVNYYTKHNINTWTDNFIVLIFWYKLSEPIVLVVCECMEHLFLIIVKNNTYKPSEFPVLSFHIKTQLFSQKQTRRLFCGITKSAGTVGRMVCSAGAFKR